MFKREAKGASVPHEKSTANLETVTMPVPSEITLLLAQHIGEPCLPNVKVGSSVKVGTLIGKARGAIGSNIYSGVSGTVKQIQPFVTASGKTVSSVCIESDGLQTLEETLHPPEITDRASFLDAIKTSGLVGLGGAGFPTDVKLTIPDEKKIDTLIINAAECEPYITSDDREILECSDTLLAGIQAVKKYLAIPKAIIGIERNKPKAMDLLFSLTKGDPSLKILPLPSNYPQGAEKVLIEAACKKEVPRGGLPADIGVLMMNVTTVSALGKFIATGMPLVTRRITVDGDAIAKPQNVEVIIGTSVADIIAFCGGYSQVPGKIILGGPMMGEAIADTNYPITKTDNGILAFSAKMAGLPQPEPCIRCGRCISACPVGLSPIEICEAYELKDIEQLNALAADVCMACGVCSFVCPAKRLVSQTTSLARTYFNQFKNKGEENNG